MRRPNLPLSILCGWLLMLMTGIIVAQQLGEEALRRRALAASNAIHAEPAPAAPEVREEPARTVTLPPSDGGHSTTEIIFSCAVLVFGLALIGIEAALALRGILSETSTFRLIGLTIVITAGLFAIPAGFSQNQMTPLMGLLGAIAGYLLGKDVPIGKEK